ncbi:helix-turn-helix domain-containing protein [Thalassobellus suaedae]|uniref:Helix-turn-helix domain-containing protein n=1 Tax=Thalassobellus suaedae TaxID=3074124 RepID=A0ABY9XVM0_9FLAO|nr:helix-turn-helix domain-containing protein [Flavobacteriaceae bacterium HL-DH14]
MGKGKFELTVTGVDPELVEAVAKKIIELTGQEVKKPEELVYTVEEVARLSDNSTQTIRIHINKGILKAHKVGKPWLIKESNLKRYLNGE